LSARAINTLRGQLQTTKGIGHEVVERFLDGVPGMNEATVKQQIANLKASGDYKRIYRRPNAQIVIVEAAPGCSKEEAPLGGLRGLLPVSWTCDGGPSQGRLITLRSSVNP
jgi:hypothetical protein